MAKRACNPSSKVRSAGKTLSKSTSKSAKSSAGKTLVNHKNKSHNK